MVLKILKNLIDQLHVNPPCGSKQLYYTKSAAHCEPQIGYLKGEMSRETLVGDIAAPQKMTFTPFAAKPHWNWALALAPFYHWQQER